MSTISLCMIVKNEEKVIGRCLDSIKEIVDEIIVVDTGSTDLTKNIVENYTNKIYDFKWEDDFSKARNFSFSKATKDYIMWLDADDIILENDIIKLKQLKNNLNPSSTHVVMMKYNISFDEDNNPTFSYYRERIFLRKLNLKWVNPIHEVIVPIGNIVYSDAAVSHKKLYQNDPLRNIRIFEKLIKNNIKLQPRELFYYGKELYYNKRYKESLEILNKFLDDKQGWVENYINACQYIAYCYYNLNKENEALTALYHSFKFDTPRAEICCDIAKHFFDRKDYKKSIFWYEIASTIEPNLESGGFVELDCYAFIPYIQLCVCYYNLGDIEKSIYYNEKAKEIKPNNEMVLTNSDILLKIKREA